MEPVVHCAVYLVIMSPQIIKLFFADLVLALVVVNIVKPIIEVSEPEYRTAHDA